VNRDHYRMGVYEITNDQWNKFKSSLGVPVTGNPSSAYVHDPHWTGPNVPTNRVSWYEAAQFINWLNTSTGHQAAYKFTGTQGTEDYTMAIWSEEEAEGGTNLFRHKDAFYYLPTEDEWMKAAYWNGTSLQIFATTGDEAPEIGVDCNAHSSLPEPWDVGSGILELNGTYDMMGNIWEFTESVFYPWLGYGIGYGITLRGGSYGQSLIYTFSGYRYDTGPGYETTYFGFRVASDVPVPIRLNAFSYDHSSGSASLTLEAEPSTAYLLKQNPDPGDFTSATTITPYSVTTGTLDGDQITTDATGKAVIQFNLGTAPRMFVKAERP
jgi:sulfatase modifying factor 1